MLTKTFIEIMIFLTKKLNTFIIILFLCFTPFSSNSTENKIIYKINNEIITSFDIKREFKYLNLINPKINNLEKDEIFEISKNSIIREKVKKIEILKHMEKIIINDNYTDKIIKNTYSKIGLNNIKEFEDMLISIDMSLDEFKEKLAIEALWNQLIYEKYKSKIKIDVDQLKKEISSKKIQKIFNLSEIVFSIEKSQDFSSKVTSIKNDIQNKGFENAALIHSVSETKTMGGELGWVNENSINEGLKNKIKNLQVGFYSEPITIPGGFLIIKLNEFKKETVSLNTDEELEKLIQVKTNQQLNRFSSIYFKKIEKDLKIEKI